MGLIYKVPLDLKSNKRRGLINGGVLYTSLCGRSSSSSKVLKGNDMLSF
jgi:hypothetical protein